MQGSLSLSTALALATLIAFIPLIAVVATCYTKLAVVLLIVRNAIGIQQTPPNLLIFAIALVLSAFIMKPVLEQTSALASDALDQTTSSQQVLPAARRAAEPLRVFMTKYANPDVTAFFVKAAAKVWATPEDEKVRGDDLLILTSSFLVSELNRAFKIGFLLYLPFLMIDFAVSALLIALGMTMMSPTVVSTPFKLLFFISVDGWRRLLEGLVLSYGGS